MKINIGDWVKIVGSHNKAVFIVGKSTNGNYLMYFKGDGPYIFTKSDITYYCMKDTYNYMLGERYSEIIKSSKPTCFVCANKDKLNDR